MRNSSMLDPPGAWVMTQRWHDLLFAHWRCSASDLRRLIPEPLEIETFDGSPWIGVVPFRMSEPLLHFSANQDIRLWRPVRVR
jgi:uncharacterized protein YqjF (DUF2071 family)